MSGPPRGQRLRRTWPQRLLISFNVVVVLAALTGAGLVAYGKRTVSQVNRVSLGRDAITPANTLADGSPQNFLVVGVDDMKGLDPDSPIRHGREEGAEAAEGMRGDTIMVVRVDPNDQQARILSFQRDLWVEIPGHGSGRINAAMAYGEESGPDLLIKTIDHNFGIDINHYVQVDLAGFQNLVDDVGGVKIYLSHPLRDPRAQLFQPDAGCINFDGEQALAYARSRHLQWQDERGRWVVDGTSDHGRISRQQDFIRRVMERAIDRGARNPATLSRMIDTGVDHITLDQHTTAQDLIDLGRAFRDYDPDLLRTYSLPVTDAVRGGAEVLDLIETGAEEILDLFRDAEDPADAGLVDPLDVTVRVLNGTGTPNQGSQTTRSLGDIGFRTRSPGDVVGERPHRTEIRHPSGQFDAALTVARHLEALPVLVADDSVAEVTVLTGPDFVGTTTAQRAIEDLVYETASAETWDTTTTTWSDDAEPGGTAGLEDPQPALSTTTTSTAVPAEVASSEPIGYVPGEVPDGVSCS